MLDILYLVGNTGDPAVGRRLRMLQAGGASVGVAGFRRAGSAPPAVSSEGYHELGQTFDARFAQRIFAIARAAGSLKARMRSRRAPDLIMARNLEMLFLAVRLKDMWGGAPAIAYECLDIHRLMLRQDSIGRSLRQLERRLARKASLLLISSPAFAREYFGKINSLNLPIRLVENKVLAGSARGQNPLLAADDARSPLRIGWFGALRCRKSLDALTRFSRRMDGAVEIVLRGRPALTEFDDFYGMIAANPFLSYEGPYQSPGDLARIYSEVHLAWAIDYFEEGQNSSWLLPNRVYEGCLHGAVPIALAGTETAAFLKSKGLGIVVGDTQEDTLVRMIGGLSHRQLHGLATAVAMTSATEFACGIDQCRELVTALAQAAGRSVDTEEIGFAA